MRPPTFPYGLVVALMIVVLATTAVADIWHVDDDGPGGDGTTWASSFNDLQAALDAAEPGDGIRVAQGTYYPSARTIPHDPRSATFQLESGVAVYGGYIGYDQPDPDVRDVDGYPTTLSGDLDGNDGPGPFENNDFNSYHVVTGTGTNGTATLDGFTVTGGNANEAYQTFGGALSVEGGGPTVRNCTFNENWASTAGGALALRYSGHPMLINCEFSGNQTGGQAGAVYVYDDGVLLTATSCRFHENVAQLGGGVSIRYGAAALLVNCTFVRNSADSVALPAWGGALHSASQLDMVNCLLLDNAADLGGGLHQLGSTPHLVSCTFAGNEAGECGGAIYNEGGDSTVIAENCVIWNNSPNQICEVEEPSTTISYSAVEGGWPGLGNIDEDPQFWDIGRHLAPGSPCIDAGDDTAVPPDTADLDGDGNTDERVPLDLDGYPRFLDDPDTDDTGVADPPDYTAVADMGAYEFGTWELVCTCGDLDGDGGATDLADFNTFQICFGLRGPTEQCPVASFECADLNQDDWINLTDFNTFQVLFGTVNTKSPPDCVR